MSTSSITSTSSSETSFIPPPPPPRILLLRGKVLHRVFAYLNDEEIVEAGRSCRLFRDAGEFEEIDLDDVSEYCDETDSRCECEDSDGEMECVSLEDELPPVEPASGAPSVASEASSLPPPPPQREQLTTPTQQPKLPTCLHPQLTLAPVARPAQEKLTLTVPPGRLGIRLDNTSSKHGTVVTLVANGSPLAGKVFGGDRIVEVNGVDVGRMDTYGTLAVFQRFMNEDRVITIIRPSANAAAYENTPIVKNDGTYSATASHKALNDSTDSSIFGEAIVTKRNGVGYGSPSGAEMTPAVNNRKALNETADTIFKYTDSPISLTTFHHGLNDTRNSKEGTSHDELNITAISSNQSKTIMRSNSLSSQRSRSTTVSTPSIHRHQTFSTPLNIPRTIPSADSDLLESLDLNSYKSENVSPLTPKDSPGKPCVPRFLEKRRSSEAIPFDELDTHVKLPDFPSNQDEQPSMEVQPVDEPSLEFFSPMTPEIASSMGMDREYDDDTITSYGSSYLSSVADTEATDSCVEEKADFLTQFADAALFGDTSLFTSFVNDLIDSAKHAAKSLVTERGDPIDDQGPIKIGDNYYTHREAIQKWKKARDKLKEENYEEGDPKLQRKLENAAMEAAQLMAATKTLDLAARRSCHYMEKKEQKRAAKEATKNASITSSWEAEELEKIHSWEKEKEAKRKKDKREESNFTIHQLVNRLSFFGFGSDVPAENEEDETDQTGHEEDEKEVDTGTPDHEPEQPIVTEEQPKNADERPRNTQIPFNSRFALLEHSSKRPFLCVDESMEEEQGDHLTEDAAKGEVAKEVPQYQYLAIEVEDDEPYDCTVEAVSSNEANVSSSHEEEDEADFGSRHEAVAEEMDTFFSKSQQPNDSDDEMEIELLEPLESSNELRPTSPSLSSHSRSVANPSPATAISYASSYAGTSYTSSFAGTNASSITELAGCGAKNKGSHQAPSVVMSECDYSTSLGSEVSAQDEKLSDDDIGAEKSMVSGVSQASTASSTSSAVSEEYSEAITESKSMFSDEFSGVLSDDAYTEATEYSESQFSALQRLSPERLTAKHIQCQPTIAEDDATLDLVGEMCGLLFTNFEGEESITDASAAQSKYTLDTMLGSQYGTEVIFKPETSEKTPTPSHSDQPKEPPVSNRNHSPMHLPPQEQRPTSPTPTQNSSTNAQRVSSGRKPRISSNNVTPSPKSGRSSPAIKDVIKISPRNPLKRIKSPVPKKSPKPAVASRQTTPDKSESASVATMPATPSPKSEKNLKGSLKMGFGVMRSRSAG